MQSRNSFTPRGTITTAHAALTNAQRYRPTVSILVPGEYVEVELKNDYNEFLEIISHVVGDDADSNVLQLYASRGKNDDYTHMVTLTFTVGTMIVRGGTKLYHDTLTLAEVDAAFETAISASAINDIAKLWINTNGYSKLLFIASTLGSTSVTVETASVAREGLPVVA